MFYNIYNYTCNINKINILIKKSWKIKKNSYIITGINNENWSRNV